MDFKPNMNDNAAISLNGSSPDITKEPVFLSEVVYDGQIEQGVEFDYVLPDYYPDIFKVLKCSLTPCVISHSISGNQLYCDGVVYIKVLYLSRENNLVNCIEQRYTYSKTIDLSRKNGGSVSESGNAYDEALALENAIVNISQKTDYCNCRAVSGRRVDVRGAVSSKVKVITARESKMITEVSGMGAQTRKTALKYCGEKLIASRQFVTREDIEVGVASNGISSIVHHDVSVCVTDYKIVADKVVVKGEATIKALYLKNPLNTGYTVTEPETDDGESITDMTNFSSSGESLGEVMEAVIPLSQIIDLKGVSEEHSCYVNLSVLDCDLEIKSDGGNDYDSGNGIFSCDLTVDCTVTAHIEKEVMPVIDMYSVDYESSFNKAVIKTESMPQIIERQLSLKGNIECNETTTGLKGSLEAVYDSRCDISNVVCRVRRNNEQDITELAVIGQATLQVFGRLNDNSPVFIEKVEPFELVINDNIVFAEGVSAENYTIEPNLQVVNTTYSIVSENSVDLRIMLRFNGCLYQVSSIEAVKDVFINGDVLKTKDTEYALKLYYAEQNEEIWDIAKRYNTSVDAIVGENAPEIEQFNGDAITSPCMLLIPII